MSLPRDFGRLPAGEAQGFLGQAKSSRTLISTAALGWTARASAETVDAVLTHRIDELMMPVVELKVYTRLILL